MISTKKLFKKILGCCYSTGSSGAWTYRKYADGTIDMWAIVTDTLTDYSQSGGLYFYSKSVSLPTNLLYDANYVLMSTWRAASTITFASWASKSTSSFISYGACLGGGQKDCVIEFYLHGRWKA